jgi:hypothetical protein
VGILNKDIYIHSTKALHVYFFLALVFYCREKNLLLKNEINLHTDVLMKYLAVPFFLILYFISADSQDLVIVRLNGSEPIITQEMFFNAGASPEEGANINGRV